MENEGKIERDRSGELNKNKNKEIEDLYITLVFENDEGNF